MGKNIIALVASLIVALNIYPQVNDEIKFSKLEEIHQYLSKRAEENEFSGVVLIAKDGKPIFKNAYGYASKRFAVPNAIDTKFNIGSLSKHITSIAILQLAEKGLLNLDDPIGTYLNVFPDNIAKKVTTKNLLTMSSGWGDYWDNETYLAPDIIKEHDPKYLFVRKLIC